MSVASIQHTLSVKAVCDSAWCGRSLLHKSQATAVQVIATVYQLSTLVAVDCHEHFWSYNRLLKGEGQMH